MRYWWVNQNQTYNEEVTGGYIWSPKRNRNGARNQFYDNMREVAPGDIIFSFRNTYISDIGIATSYCYDAPKPTEFGNVGLYWENTGWRVDVLYQPLTSPIRPKDHIDQLRPLLPDKYSPLQHSGDGLQSVYLAEVPNALGLRLEELLSGAGNLIVRNDFELPVNYAVHESMEEEYEIQRNLLESPEISQTEKQELRKSRLGQGKFRRNVQLIERECRVTKIDNPTHLKASHIKPWRHSDNQERLDGCNGLMLSPDVDHLFDHGFISFSPGGQLLISPVAERESIQRMGIDPKPGFECGAFNEHQKQFLEFHRQNIFLKA